MIDAAEDQQHKHSVRLKWLFLPMESGGFEDKTSSVSVSRSLTKRPVSVGIRSILFLDMQNDSLSLEVATTSICRRGDVAPTAASWGHLLDQNLFIPKTRLNKSF